MKTTDLILQVEKGQDIYSRNEVMALLNKLESEQDESKNIKDLVQDIYNNLKISIEDCIENFGLNESIEFSLNSNNCIEGSVDTSGLYKTIMSEVKDTIEDSSGFSAGSIKK